MMLTMTASGGAKHSTTAMVAGFAAIGITSDDLPNIFVLAIGALVGTALAWARAGQDGANLPRKWIAWQTAMCAFFAMFVLFLQWLTGVDDGRPTGFVMGALSYLGREALNAISSGLLDSIKERIFKTGGSK